MDNKDSTFAGHNYKAEYKFKSTIGMKANGEVQIKEVKTSGDEAEQVVEVSFDIFINTYKTGKSKHLKMVSPFEKGYEPEF